RLPAFSADRFASTRRANKRIFSAPRLYAAVYKAREAGMTGGDGGRPLALGEDLPDRSLAPHGASAVGYGKSRAGGQARYTGFSFSRVRCTISRCIQKLRDL